MRTLHYLARAKDIQTVSKKLKELSAICGFKITRKKLNRITINGVYFSEEYLSLKMAKMFPARVKLISVVKENGVYSLVNLLDDEEISINL